MFDSPKRLISLLVASICLAGAALLISRLHGVQTSTPVSGVSFVGLCIGLLSMWWTTVRLRDGIQTERWPAAQLQPLRRVVKHPAWTPGLLLLCALMVATLLLGRQARSFFWVLFCLLQAMSQLSQAFAPPRPTRPGQRLDWSQVAPLHSSHWGER